MSVLFRGGRVFTATGAFAEAVLVRDGVVAAVGAERELARLAPSHETVDLGGGLLVPGFTDAHLHPVQAGLERARCDLAEVFGLDAYLAAVRTYAAANPGKEWIDGGGWDMSAFPGGLPRREQLDFLDRPAYLIQRDHHAAWVNSRALELAGITRDTPDPADGRIERDPDGTPTGVLHEGAMDLVGRLLPEPTAEELRAGLLEAQRYLHAHGVTGWQEAILGDYAGYPDASFVYRNLAAEGLLTARATGALWVPRSTTLDNIGELVAGFEERRRESAAAGFTTTSAKIMVDGVAENQTAAMLEPYLRPCSCDGDAKSASDDGGRGLSYLPREVLIAAAGALDAAGFDLHMHVIGDRAVRDGLDAVEHALQVNSRGANGSGTAWRGRHHMAHLQVIHPQDVSRFAALGVTANAQALWACNDDQMLELTLPILGPERSSWQYPFKSLVSAGAALAMGSDWPVSTPDPWQAIHVAVNRNDPDTTDIPPLNPGEALSLETALAAYTSGSARLNRLDDGGMVAPGMLADLVVLDRNPFDLAPEDLHTVSTDLTMVSGQAVHVREGARV